MPVMSSGNCTGLIGSCSKLRPKRCVPLYVDLLPAVLGFMDIRFQTWFPFLVQIYLNAREWLAPQMTAANSLKMYDKGSVLRIETTINDASGFRVLRAPTGQSQGPKKWRKLRRSTADLQRRAQVSHAATQRYLNALSVVDDRIALAEEAAHICRRARYRQQSFRALNPLAPADAHLRTAVNDAKFTVNGFTNADLRTALFGTPRDHALEKKRASKVTRLIRLLRAPRLLTKVSKANRYHVSRKGRRIITALLTARNADIEQLTKTAA